MSYEDNTVLSAVGRENIDVRMRAAYERWRTAFYEQNIETTPAYDVIGLLAALCLSSRRSAKTYFDIGSLGSNKNVLQEGAQVYKLLAKYRTKDALASIFSDLEGFRSSMFKLLIITDFGEETDDEVTCLLANKLHTLGLADVRFLFTTTQDRFEKQKSRFTDWGGNPDIVCSIYAKNTVVDWLNEHPVEEEKEVESAKSIILQIGPVHEPTNAAGWRTVWRPNVAAYDYVVVGTLNGVPALNVKANARDSALHLMSGAETKIVVDTMAGLGAFNFCAESLSSLFGAVDPTTAESRVSIQEHVCRIGWRNSVGRASPFAARFVAHLVSEPVGAFGGGANYMTVRKIQEDLDGEVVSNARSRAIAEKYLDQLQNRPGPPNFNFMKLTVADDGSTNNPNGATSESIINGYAYILDCLNTFFGVPIEFFESGQPEKWNRQWKTPSNYDLTVHEDVSPFAVDPQMRVLAVVPSESAFTTGIPAGSGLIGIGRYTQGLALQMRSKHPPNTMLLRGHYKLLNSADKLDELMSKHLNISSDLLRNMQQKLCTSKSRKVSSVVAAIHKELGTDKSRELIERHLFSTDQWRLI